MSDTPQDIYRYADRAQQALLDMVRGVMREAEKDGLAGAHHFYLTFLTHAEGVDMDEALRANNPIDITIVLQNQFDDLKVSDTFFEVTLYFNNEPHRLHVPFDAVTKFYDPSVAFGLMFDVEPPEDDPAGLAAPDEMAESEQNPVAEPGSGDVVSLDTFRNK